MDDRDQGLLAELSMHVRIRPEALRRFLGWNAKTFDSHVRLLVRDGKIRRSEDRRGTWLEIAEDGETPGDRIRNAAWREIQDILGRARWEGRVPTSREVFDDWGALARARGPPRTGGRGRPRAPLSALSTQPEASDDATA